MYSVIPILIFTHIYVYQLSLDDLLFSIIHILYSVSAFLLLSLKFHDRIINRNRVCWLSKCSPVRERCIFILNIFKYLLHAYNEI